MKWNTIVVTEPKDFEKRSRKLFLLFPKKALNQNTGQIETRWLENATVIEEYSVIFGWGSSTSMYFPKNRKWANK